MATAITATGFQGGMCSSFCGTWVGGTKGEDYNLLVRSVSVPVRVRKPIRSQPMMRNINEGKGLFAPVVVVTRNIIGMKRFNQLRGKAIALHSQVITEFCKAVGADAKQRQGLIRLAKKNGERLGFLAWWVLKPNEMLINVWSQIPRNGKCKSNTLIILIVFWNVC